MIMEILTGHFRAKEISEMIFLAEAGRHGRQPVSAMELLSANEPGESVDIANP